jgi:hypothetical protein
MHDPFALSLLTGGAAYLMTVAGVAKRGLEWKHRGRACRSCGLDARRCRCRRRAA